MTGRELALMDSGLLITDAGEALVFQMPEPEFRGWLGDQTAQDEEFRRLCARDLLPTVCPCAACLRDRYGTPPTTTRPAE